MRQAFCQRFGREECIAQRSDGTAHGGGDWVNRVGQIINAPASGTINAIYKYNGMGAISIDIGRGYSVQLLYTSPTIKVDDSVTAGQPIGTAIDLALHYTSQMTNHTHVQIKNPTLNVVVNPTNLIPH